MKSNGLGSLFFVDGYDISGDVASVDRISASNTPFDVTAINGSAHERIFGLNDGEMAFTHFFNDAAAQEHVVLKAKAAGADRVVTYFKGSAIGNMAASLVAKQMNYDWSRNADGSLMGQVQCLANTTTLDYCEQLTAGKRTDASATNGASLDGGAATTIGLVAYIQVFALTSGSPTVKIQESSDDAVGDPYADVTGGTFGVVAANTAARIVTSLTLPVERYLRVVTTGTFSGLTFAVCASRYPVVS